MGGTDVGVFLAGEERSVRRQVVTRSALAFGLGPATAFLAYAAATQTGVVDPGVEMLSLAALSLLVTTVAVSGLVVLFVVTERPVVLFLVGGVLTWLATTIALEATESGAWMGAVMLASCVVVAPLAMVLVLVRRPLAAWAGHERTAAAVRGAEDARSRSS